MPIQNIEKAPDVSLRSATLHYVIHRVNSIYTFCFTLPSSDRNGLNPDSRYYYYGFRLLQEFNSSNEGGAKSEVELEKKESPANESTNREMTVANIRPVPNPFIISSITDLKNQGSMGISFENVPFSCEISIYAPAGDLVKRLDKDLITSEGKLFWDLKSNEGVIVASGVYIYVAKVIGQYIEKRGKVAIIK